MKNYVQPGNTITLTAPYAVASGDGLLVGSIFGIAAGAAALGEPVETALVGVFDITKVGSQALDRRAPRSIGTTPTSAAPRSPPTTLSSAWPSRRWRAARATPSAGCA